MVNFFRVLKRGEIMANIKSQVKRIRTNEKGRSNNVSVKTAVKTEIKKVRLAVEAKDLEEALDIIEEKYNSQEIVLGAEDFKEHEIREYVDKVRIQDLKKDAIFNIKSGKAILLEGNEKKALIKKIGVKEYPYVVVTGLTVNKYQTYFEWNQGTYFQNISEADERFIQMAGYDQIQNDINYSEIGEWT